MTGRPVAAAEIERWIKAVYELNGTEQADLCGGVAPSVIVDHCDTERVASTVATHLQHDGRVSQTYGVHVGHNSGGRRTSYVPTEDSFTRLVADGEGGQ